MRGWRAMCMTHHGDETQMMKGDVRRAKVIDTMQLQWLEPI